MTPTFATLAALTHPVALAVGRFDGVHLGHQAILMAMLENAKKQALEPWILTFEGAPTTNTNAPSHSALRIYDAPLQADVLAQYGAMVIQQSFTPAFSALTATDFLASLRDAAIFCGADWRFGKGAEGDVDFLKAHGCAVTVVPDVCYENERISSTRIRQALAIGAMDQVTAMLGRPWEFCGVVQHGRGLAAKTFGVPTLNVPYVGRKGEVLAPLARGVYCGEATILRDNGSEATFDALINFGTAPTLKGEDAPLFEVHLLGICGDFYGATVRLSLSTPMMRPEQKFDSIDALRCQIYRDLATCRGRHNR